MKFAVIHGCIPIIVQVCAQCKGVGRRIYPVSSVWVRGRSTNLLRWALGARQWLSG